MKTHVLKIRYSEDQFLFLYLNENEYQIYKRLYSNSIELSVELQVLVTCKSAVVSKDYPRCENHRILDLREGDISFLQTDLSLEYKTKLLHSDDILERIINITKELSELQEEYRSRLKMNPKM